MRQLAAAYMANAPGAGEASGLLDWIEPLVQAAAANPDTAAALHRLYTRVVRQGLGGGARAMHAHLGGVQAAPRWQGIESPEALLLAVTACLAIDALPLPAPPCDAHALQLRQRALEARLQHAPDVLDELLLEASRLVPRDDAWRARVEDVGNQLSGAGRWFRGGTGKALERQAKRVERAFSDAELPLPHADRWTAWARWLTVVVALAVPVQG